MNINLLEVLKTRFNAMVLVKIADHIEEFSSNTFSALNIVMPIVLGNFIKKASTTEGLEELTVLLEESMFPKDLHSKLHDIVTSNEDFDQYISSSESTTHKILGHSLDKLNETVSSESGISKESSKVLFQIVTPVLITLINQRNQSQGWGKSGLASWLMNQSEHVLNELPSGVAEIIGFDDLGDFLGTNKTKDSEESPKLVIMILPWILGLIALLAALYYIRTCNKPTTNLYSLNNNNLINEANSDTLQKTNTHFDSTINTAFEYEKRHLIDGTELNIPSVGIESKLISFIEDKTKPIDKDTWFEFDRLYFKVNSAVLDTNSDEQLENISLILKAYPAVKIKIGGYTDNIGASASNISLSSERAKAVLVSLIKKGIESNRLSSEGYGDQYPVADNNTEEGRNKNRRVAIKLKSK